MAFQVKAYDDIVSDMIAWIVAHNSSITDLSPGSVIRSFCEGAGLCMEEIYVAVYLGFRRYLDKIQETTFAFDRKSGTKSQALVRFGRAVATVDAKTVAAGVGIKTESGLVFYTAADAVIPANQTQSNLVTAYAADVGVAYNVFSTAIKAFVVTLDGVDTVTNPNAAYGGVDKETDYQYKKRFQAYIEGLGRGNLAGLIAGALSVEGITSASVLEYFPPQSNVNVALYVDNGSSTGVTAEVLAQVQAVIDGDGTEQNPGYRSAGVNVLVSAPGVIVQDVTMTVSVIEGVDTEQIIIDIKDAITNYINNLGVGSDIVKNELIYEVMNVYGVEDCSITTPSANVVVSASQVGRVGTISVGIV